MEKVYFKSPKSYYWRHRHINKWNKIKKPKIDPPKYVQLIFDKDTK